MMPEKMKCRFPIHVKINTTSPASNILVCWLTCVVCSGSLRRTVSVFGIKSRNVFIYLQRLKGCRTMPFPPFWRTATELCGLQLWMVYVRLFLVRKKKAVIVFPWWHLVWRMDCKAECFMTMRHWKQKTGRFISEVRTGLIISIPGTWYMKKLPTSLF